MKVEDFMGADGFGVDHLDHRAMAAVARVLDGMFNYGVPPDAGEDQVVRFILVTGRRNDRLTTITNDTMPQAAAMIAEILHRHTRDCVEPGAGEIAWSRHSRT